MALPETLPVSYRSNLRVETGTPNFLGPEAAHEQAGDTSTPFIGLTGSAAILTTTSDVATSLASVERLESHEAFYRVLDVVRRIDALRELDTAEGPKGALAQIRAVTRLPVSGLADLLTVSRKTIYNWMSGSPISATNAERIVEVREQLAPLVRRWRPNQIRVWLQMGDPSPLELARTRQWEQIAERISEASEEPFRPLLPAPRISEAESAAPAPPIRGLEPEEWRHLLVNFSTPRRPTGYSRREQPELTGLASKEADE